MAEPREPANRWPDDAPGGVPHRQRWEPAPPAAARSEAARRVAPPAAGAVDPPATTGTARTSIVMAGSIALVAFVVLLFALATWDGGEPTVVPAPTVPEASDAGTGTPGARGGPA